MKNLRKLLPALCLLLISAMCAGSSTYAWFTMNNQVSASGMEIKAEAASSLVIGDHPLTLADDSREIVLTSTATVLTPITKVANVVTADIESGSNTTGFVVVTNPEDVAAASGKAVAGKTLKYKYVPASTDGSYTYYIDYIMYVGVHGQSPINCTALITLAGEDCDTHKAMTAEITINGATQTLLLNASNPTANSISLPITAPVIPATGSVSTGMIKIRCYFDGALAKNGSTFYVNTATISTDKLGLGVLVTANNE